MLDQDKEDTSTAFVGCDAICLLTADGHQQTKVKKMKTKSYIIIPYRITTRENESNWVESN